MSNISDVTDSIHDWQDFGMLPEEYGSWSYYNSESEGLDIPEQTYPVYLTKKEIETVFDALEKETFDIIVDSIFSKLETLLLFQMTETNIQKDNIVDRDELQCDYVDRIVDGLDIKDLCKSSLSTCMNR